jgi:uncharacterized protein (DUF1501 family)
MNREPTLITRRSFLRTGLVGGSLAWSVPSFLHATMQTLQAATQANPARAGTGRDQPVLVVLQLAGGNDGLNTVVPVGNDDYHRARPKLGIAKADALRLDDDFALHPALTGFKSLFDDGRLAILHGVGYPNPNRSHFRSMEIWHTATDSDKSALHGWIGRYFDNQCKGEDPAVGISLSAQTPQAFLCGSAKGVCFVDPGRFRVLDPSMQDDDDHAMMAAEADGGNAGGSVGMISGAAAITGDPLDFLERTALDAQVSSDEIQAIMKGTYDGPAYPGTRLAADLRNVARMIAGGMPTRIYYVSLGGFDTHANQAGAHERLLRDTGGAVKAFLDDLKRQGNHDRVTLMAFSEFGRRVKENGSGGTDHGAAAPLFLAGAGVKAGLHGKFPGLADKDLLNGDVRHTTDFRSVYATVLGRVLKTDPKLVLGREFPLLDVMRG